MSGVHGRLADGGILLRRSQFFAGRLQFTLGNARRGGIGVELQLGDLGFLDQGFHAGQVGLRAIVGGLAGAHVSLGEGEVRTGGL